MTPTNNFTKIGQWKKQPDEYQKMIYSDGKLWFFGKKFVDQPTYHWGHHIIFGGASVDYFDVTSKEWSTSVQLPALAQEEHLDEVLFAYQSSIFLLLYTHFGDFLAHSLHRFEGGNWRKLLDFPGSTAPAPPEESSKNTLILVDGHAPGGVYLLSYVRHQYAVHLLALPPNGTPTLTTLVAGDCMQEEVTFSRLQPTQAAHANGLLFIQGGLHGCGFRWQPNQLIRIRLSDKTATFVEFGNEDGTTTHSACPSFSNTGSFSHSILPDKNEWLHIAGTNAVGMTGSAFNGQIWALQGIMDGDGPKWKRMAMEVPRTASGHSTNLHVVCVPECGQIFVAHEELGVLAGNIPSS